MGMGGTWMLVMENHDDVAVQTVHAWGALLLLSICHPHFISVCKVCGIYVNSLPCMLEVYVWYQKEYIVRFSCHAWHQQQSTSLALYTMHSPTMRIGASVIMPCIVLWVLFW